MRGNILNFLKALCIICLSLILIGCSNRLEEQEEKKREEELVQYVKSLDSSGSDTSNQSTSTKVLAASEKDVEELLGISLDDYRDDDQEMGRMKTELYNLILKDELNSFSNFSIEQVKDFFVKNPELSVSDLIEQFGKPVEITIYRSGRYDNSAQVLLEWRLVNRNDTENVKDLEIRWNIWDNTDKATREVEVTKYSSVYGYDIRTQIMIDGVLQQ